MVPAALAWMFAGVNIVPGALGLLGWQWLHGVEGRLGQLAEKVETCGLALAELRTRQQEILARLDRLENRVETHMGSTPPSAPIVISPDNTA